MIDDYAVGAAGGVIVINSESLILMHRVLPQHAFGKNDSCPRLVIVTGVVGKVVYPWKAARKVSLNTNGCALQHPVFATTVTVAVTGTNTVVSTSRAVPAL